MSIRIGGTAVVLSPQKQTLRKQPQQPVVAETIPRSHHAKVDYTRHQIQNNPRQQFIEQYRQNSPETSVGDKDSLYPIDFFV